MSGTPVFFSVRNPASRAEQSYELLNVVTLRHLPYPPVYFSLANIDLPEYYLVLVAGNTAASLASFGLTFLCFAVEIRAIVIGLPSFVP